MSWFKVPETRALTLTDLIRAMVDWGVMEPPKGMVQRPLDFDIYHGRPGSPVLVKGDRIEPQDRFVRRTVFEPTIDTEYRGGIDTKPFGLEPKLKQLPADIDVRWSNVQWSQPSKEPLMALDSVPTRIEVPMAFYGLSGKSITTLKEFFTPVPSTPAAALHLDDEDEYDTGEDDFEDDYQEEEYKSVVATMQAPLVQTYKLQTHFICPAQSKPKECLICAQLKTAPELLKQVSACITGNVGSDEAMAGGGWDDDIASDDVAKDLHRGAPGFSSVPASQNISSAQPSLGPPVVQSGMIPTKLSFYPATPPTPPPTIPIDVESLATRYAGWPIEFRNMVGALKTGVICGCIKRPTPSISGVAGDRILIALDPGQEGTAPNYFGLRWSELALKVLPHHIMPTDINALSKGQWFVLIAPEIIAVRAMPAPAPIDLSRYPHKCGCGAPAYVGFATTECSSASCKNHR